MHVAEFRVWEEARSFEWNTNPHYLLYIFQRGQTVWVVVSKDAKLALRSPSWKMEEMGCTSLFADIERQPQALRSLGLHTVIVRSCWKKWAGVFKFRWCDASHWIRKKWLWLVRLAGVLFTHCFFQRLQVWSLFRWLTSITSATVKIKHETVARGQNDSDEWVPTCGGKATLATVLCVLLGSYVSVSFW